MVIGGLVEKSYYDKLNFYAQMVRKGRKKEFEWLRDQLLNMAPHTGGTVLPNNTETKSRIFISTPKRKPR